MRKKIILATCAMAMVAGVAYATAKKNETPKNNQTQIQQKTISATANQQAITVNLYAAPNSEKVLQQIPVYQRLIPIYRKGEWVKVGNPKNGQVGWINSKQFESARSAYFRPDIQTIYVQFSQDKNGKPTWNVIAYRNGKKVSEQEAQKLYNALRQQQQQQYREMHSMTRWLDGMNDQLWADMPSPWAGPMVVVPNMPPLPEPPQMASAPREQQAAALQPAARNTQ